MKLTEHFAKLIEKYEAGTASPEEIIELNEWYHSFDDTAATVASDNRYIAGAGFVLLRWYSS